MRCDYAHVFLFPSLLRGWSSRCPMVPQIGLTQAGCQPEGMAGVWAKKGRWRVSRCEAYGRC